MESDNDQERRRFMSRIILHAYSDLIDGIELARSTRGDVLDAFKSAGSGPETAEKAVSFFVGLALDAEIPLHTQLSTKPKTARRRKKFSGRKGQNQLAGENLKTDILAQFGSLGVDGLNRLQGIHPAIIGLLGELPDPDDSWSQEAMVSFLKAFEAVVRLVYEPDTNSEARDGSYGPSKDDPLDEE
jgi:hypothetical protein